MPVQMIIVLAAASASAVFVLGAGAQLPDVVASHFNGSGRPDGTAPRWGFVSAMALLTAGVPVLVWWVQDRSIRAGKARVPHREFWLAGARRPKSERWLRSHAAAFSVATTVFFTYVYWLVVRANMKEPAALETALLWPALATYVGVAVAWSIAPHLRFHGGGGR